MVCDHFIMISMFHLRSAQCGWQQEWACHCRVVGWMHASGGRAMADVEPGRFTGVKYIGIMEGILIPFGPGVAVF